MACLVTASAGEVVVFPNTKGTNCVDEDEDEDEEDDEEDEETWGVKANENKRGG